MGRSGGTKVAEATDLIFCVRTSRAPCSLRGRFCPRWELRRRGKRPVSPCYPPPALRGCPDRPHGADDPALKIGARVRNSASPEEKISLPISTTPFCRFERRFACIDQHEILTVILMSMVAFPSTFVKGSLGFHPESFAIPLES